MNEKEKERLDLLANRQFACKQIYTGQVPDRLLKSKNCSMGARVVYGVLHSLSPKKRLDRVIKIAVSIRFLKDECNIHTEATLRKYLYELREHGWIDIVRRGYPKTNLYKLYPSPIKPLLKVQMKLNSDLKLRKKLQDSLKPKVAVEQRKVA